MIFPSFAPIFRDQHTEYERSCPDLNEPPPQLKSDGGFRQVAIMAGVIFVRLNYVVLHE